MYTADDILWTAGFFNERFPAPISPLGWSMLGPLIEDIALRDPLRFLGFPQAESIPLICLWRGHPYSNAMAFHIFYRVFPDALMPEDAYRYFPEGDVSRRKDAPYPRSIVSPRFLISLLRAFFSDPEDFSPWHNHRKWLRYMREHDSYVDSLKSRTRGLASADPVAIFEALGEAEDIHRRFLRIHRWSLMHADLTVGFVKRLARAWISKERADEIVAVLVSGAFNKTMEVDADLRVLWKHVSTGSLQAINWEEFTSSVTPATLALFEEFLAKHGHRSFSLDIAVPTFAEEPMQVVRLLCGFNEERDSVSQSPVLEVNLSWFRRHVLNSVSFLARKYSGLREDQRYFWQKSLALSRQLYLILGNRLVEDGIISSPQDVFFATHEELAAHFRGKRLDRARIAARSIEWREFERESRESSSAAYPPFLRGDTPLHAEKREQDEWKGRAVSPGHTRGAARIVRSAQDLSRVQRGDILVAPSTDPAWTPVFSIIAGLVMERGGVLSHGAVVAREYHLPAVAGVANILDEIRDGDWIQVDGSRGVVARVSN